MVVPAVTGDCNRDGTELAACGRSVTFFDTYPNPFRRATTISFALAN
jgi:hypothetical protein